MDVCIKCCKGEYQHICLCSTSLTSSSFRLLKLAWSDTTTRGRSNFSDRKASIVGINESVEIGLTRSCPLRSICGPYIWNLMMYSLLEQLESICKLYFEGSFDMFLPRLLPNSFYSWHLLRLSTFSRGRNCNGRLENYN